MLVYQSVEVTTLNCPEGGSNPINQLRKPLPSIAKHPPTTAQRFTRNLLHGTSHGPSRGGD